MKTDQANDWISAEGVADLVSIVVPTHNRAELLKETLTSLFRQTYSQKQIVVVDDGSHDNTEDVVAEFAKSNQDCEVIYHRQESSGGPVARNAGAKLTTGEFVVFMDDDDLVPDKFLESRINALKANGSAKLAFGLWHIFDVADGVYRTLSIQGRIPANIEFDWYSFVLGDWQLLLQGCVIRRELIASVGPWRAGLQKSQDLEYKSRLLAHEDCKTVFVPEEPVFYRLHGASISGVMTTEKMDSYVEVVDQLETMTVSRPDYEQKKDVVAEFLWNHSFWLYSVGELARGHRQLQRAKVHNPKICQTKGLFPATLDFLGLGSVVGPAYHIISKCKKSLGLSARQVISTTDKLPTQGIVDRSS